MKDQNRHEYNPHSSQAHSGFDDTLVVAFVAHIAANETHELDKTLEDIDSLSIIHRQLSEDHLYITDEDPREEKHSD